MMSQIGAATNSSEVTAGSAWELLRTVMTVAGSPPGTSSPDVGLERSRLFTSVLLALRHIAERQPVILLLEDIQWADPSSLDLLNFLARTAGQERALFLLTCRDDAIPGASNARRAIRDLSRAKISRDIRLRPLSPDEIRELLATSDVQLPVEQHDTVRPVRRQPVHRPRARVPGRGRRRPHRGATACTPGPDRRAAG